MTVWWTAAVRLRQTEWLKWEDLQQSACGQHWVEAGQSTYINQQLDFIYMTGHAFQALRTDDDALALLRTTSDHPATGGCFAFETRNPALRAWLAWNRENRRVVTTAEHDRIAEYYDAVPNQKTGLIDLTHYYQVLDEGSTAVGHSRLRFINQDHVERLVLAAKLTPIAWYGDWDRTPLQVESREFIVVTRRADNADA
jgi:hypothetical protein